MSEMIVDVEIEKRPSDQDVPQLNDEGKGESNNRVVVHKVPWTKTEDAIVSEHVKNNGDSNWNAIQKLTGICRSGRSYRFRWKDQLRPNLKKGAFTAEEERLVAKLHRKMGNKWSCMAPQLSGRTDNDIKNYWNTHIKRCKRAGLPLYPPEVCAEELEESELGQKTTMKVGDRGETEFLLGNSYQKNNPNLLNNLGSSSELLSNGIYLPLPHFENFKHDEFAKSLISLPLPLPPSLNSICISHSLPIGKPPAFKPTVEAVKSELSSLQDLQTDLGRRDTSSPPPSNESIYGTPMTTCLQKSDHSECLAVNTNRNSFNEQQLAEAFDVNFLKVECAKFWTGISVDEYYKMAGWDSCPWNNMLGAVCQIYDLP